MTTGDANPPAQPAPVRWPMVVIAVAVLVVFGRLCFAEFTVWDDGTTVYSNPHLNPPSFANLPFVWSHFAQGLYVPVTYSAWIALAMVARVGQPDEHGATLDPYIFHCANVLVHLLTAIVVYQLLLRLARNPLGAMMGALLWAVHPLQVETVGWISGLKDLLAGLFGMIALWRYVVRVQSGRSTPDAIGSIALILAMLSKPSAMMTPAVAVVMDWLLVRHSLRKALVSTAGWFAIVLPFAVVARHAQVVFGTVQSPLWSRPLIAADSIAFYLKKLVFPHPLTIDYGHSWMRLIHEPALYWTWLVPMAIAIMIILARKSKPWLAAGGLIFLLAILPVSGLFTFQFQYASTTSDHYVYVAMLGPALIVACLLSQYPSRAICGLVTAALCVFAAIAFHQSQFWRNDMALFSHAVEVNPQSFLAHNDLGMAYQFAGEPAKAIAEYRISADLSDQFPTAYDNLARILGEQGDTDGAIRAIEQSIEIRARLGREQYPDYMEDHNRVGQVLLERGRYREAIAHFQALLQVDPDHAEARKYLQIAQQKLAVTKPSTLP